MTMAAKRLRLGEAIDEVVTYDDDYESEQRDGVKALHEDLLTVQTTNKPPDALDWYVLACGEQQLYWYNKLYEAWKKEQPVPATPEAATRFVFYTLQRLYEHGGLLYQDLQGFLRFYGLPSFLSVITRPTPNRYSPDKMDASPPQDDVPLFKFWTLPVVLEEVTDGCGFLVYVKVDDFSLLPRDLVYFESQRRMKKYLPPRYFELDNNTPGDYRLLRDSDGDFLAKKYHIRLRGIRVRKTETLDGSEARDELARLVIAKCLRVIVFRIDDRVRCFGDVYYNGNLLQDFLLNREDASCYWERVDLGKEDEPSQ